MFSNAPVSFPILNASITMDQAQIVWGKQEEWCSDRPNFAHWVDDIKHTPFPTIYLSTGREIWARSTQYKCKYIRGHKFAAIGYDEMAYGNSEDLEVIRMRLADTGGPILGGTTPAGKNWYYREIWQPGQAEIAEAQAEGRKAKTFLMQATTFDNPHVDHAFIRGHIMPRMTERQIDQEIMGEFVESGNTPWSADAVDRIKDADLNDSLLTPAKTDKAGIAPGRWILGWDLAKAVDWTVCCGLDVSTKPWRLRYFDRFQKRPWPEVETAIKEAQARFDADVIFDTTGVGAVTYDHLDLPIWRLTPFVFTPKSKAELINNLAYCIEKGLLKIPAIMELLRELYAYEWDDANLETDIVMALALACWKANDEKPPMEVVG
jgi:hypothetical protein